MMVLRPKVGYVGNHYGAGECDVSVVFECSNDGEKWKPVGKDIVVYIYVQN